MLDGNQKEFAQKVAEYVRDILPGYEDRDKFYTMQDAILAILDDQGLFEDFLDGCSEHHWKTIQRRVNAVRSSTEMKWRQIDKTHHGRRATVGLKDPETGLLDRNSLVIGRIDYKQFAARPVLWDQEDQIQTFGGDYFVILDD